MAQRQANISVTRVNGDTAGVAGSPPSSHNPLSPNGSLDSSNTSDNDLDINQIMIAAFGESLDSSELPYDHEWIKRWLSVTHLKGKLYHVPGGSVGGQYVDLLSSEISHLASGNFPSERLLVFSGVCLQCSRMVKKGLDIRRVLKRRMEM
jgi:hypothetical protein